MYRQYPKYREGQFELIAEVPSHWILGQVKYAHDIALGKMLQTEAKSSSDKLCHYIRAANITWNGVDLTSIRKMWFSPIERKSLYLEAGDVVISEGGDVGRSAVWQGELSECYFQNAINRARPKGEHSNHFLYYWMSFLKKAGYIDIICNKSTIPHYTAEKVQGTPFVIPPTDEQRNIAAFLDHETAKVDRLIARQEQLIELLKEKRQAVISHAVTKGLNPDALMKDSGVEWLGEVPAHWAVSKVGFVSMLIQTGPFGSQLHAEDYVEGGIPVINPAHIQAGKIIPDEQVTVNEETVKRIARHQLVANEIIFARRGELGRCALVTPDTEGWICGTGSLKISLNKCLVEPAFISRFLGIAGVKGELSLSSKGSTMENLNAEILSGVVITFPGIEEQRDILQYLRATEEKMELLLQLAEDAVTLLREHRTALISAAVTGKINVRGWKRPSTEPEEIATTVSS